MNKKMLIGAGIVAVIIIIYALVGKSNLAKMAESVDAKWPESEKQYQTRLATIEKFEGEIKDAMVDDQKLLANLEKSRGALKEAKTVDEKVKAVSNVEKNLAKVILALEKYPEVKNTSVAKESVDKLAGQGSSAWLRAYNDEAAKYNIAIKRIRYKLVSAIFGLEPKRPAATASEFIKAETERADKQKKK